VDVRNSTVAAAVAAILALVVGFAYGNLFGLEQIFELQKWQALIGAGVALLAAALAFFNTTRSLDHAAKLEDRRRSRKHAAVRAMLPLALSQILDYADRSAHRLNELVAICQNDILLPMTAPENHPQNIPTETLRVLAEFIEYSDIADVSGIEATVALIQIHDARIRALVARNRDPSGTWIIRQEEIEARIVNAASIYAGAASVFDYARQRQGHLTPDISWDAVRRALRNMQFWEDEYPRLEALIARRERTYVGPFDELRRIP
jgi:hypothetical protein